MSHELFQVLLLTMNIMMGAVAIMFGWLLRSLFGSIDELRKTDAKLADIVAAVRADLPERYVLRDDFKDLGDNIFTALRRIEDKLDKKVDKS